jgi:hypothetical protein
MNVLPNTSVLPPLHGVKLSTDAENGDEHNHSNHGLPFALSVTVNYNQNTQTDSPAIWTLLDEGERYTSKIQLFKQDTSFELQVECEGQGSFIFDESHLTVNWQSDGTGFEHYLQSLGMAVWLELKGIPCIHANAITLNGDAFLVIAPSRTGKSTLTTHLLTHGFKLMTDDMAAIHPKIDGSYTIYPSWAKVRLWPDMANQLVGTQVDSKDIVEQDTKPQVGAKSRKRVHKKFAKHEIDLGKNNQQWWANSAANLKGIYYLDRLETGGPCDNSENCEISEVGPSKGLVVLLQNSMLANAYRSMGVEQQRLTAMAKLLNGIPIYKIEYASGIDKLPAISENIKAHMSALK